MNSNSTPSLTKLEDLFAAGIQVELINLTDGIVLLDNGDQLPIVTMFDEEGDETQDPEGEIAAVVAGSDAIGWLTIHMVTTDDEVTLH